MTEFEKAATNIDNDKFTGETEQENVIEFLKGEKTATVTFSQGRYITKIKKLAEKHPEDVQIVYENKNSIVAHVPVRYIKISQPRYVSVEQRRAMASRLKIKHSYT